MGLFQTNITLHVPEVEKLLKDVLNLTIINNLKLKKIMATIAQLSAKVDDLQSALDAEQQQIADAIATLNQTVSDLQALVADGGTEADRQAVADKLDAVISDLEATIPDQPKEGGQVNPSTGEEAPNP